MNPYNLQTSAMALVVALATACGAADSANTDGRDESFLELMGAEGKADSLTVTDGSAEALGVLEVANTLSYGDLTQLAGLDRRAAANILAMRERDPQTDADDDPFDSLEELDQTPWVGIGAFTALFNHARDFGFVDAARYPTACQVDQDCGGTGVCHVDHCYDLHRVPTDLGGTLTFDVAKDGSWWIRSHSGGGTVREALGSTAIEAVSTSTYPDHDLNSWLAELPDGTLTAVTRSADDVIPEFGMPTTFSATNHAVDVLYDATGDLFVAAEARNADGIAQGFVVVRQTESGWLEELKHAFDTEREPGDLPNLQLSLSDAGEAQLWVDVGRTTRRYDRNSGGGWRESLRIPMADEGFANRAVDRDVTIMQAGGVTFVHRATWNFARRHQVLRIEASTVTAVIDLPTAARSIAPHDDGTFSVVHADGALTRYVHGAERRGTARLPIAPSGSEIVRANGEDIYVLAHDELVVLLAR